MGTANVDPTRLFPGDGLILEVSGVHTDDPQKLFGRKIYDNAKKTFNDPPPLKYPRIDWRTS